MVNYDKISLNSLDVSVTPFQIMFQINQNSYKWFMSTRWSNPQRFCPFFLENCSFAIRAAWFVFNLAYCLVMKINCGHSKRHYIAASFGLLLALIWLLFRFFSGIKKLLVSKVMFFLCSSIARFCVGEIRVAYLLNRLIILLLFRV